MKALKTIVRWIVARLYRIEVHGLEHYRSIDGPALIVANHASFLDGILLTLFLPDRLTFAVNTHVAKRWWSRIGLAFVEFFTLDPLNPLNIKSLIQLLRKMPRARVVIFPEGRITVTGALMKVYQGPGLVAERARVPVVPVRIEGAQFTPFSRLRGRVRLRWFPKITLTILPPRRIDVGGEVKGRGRRNRAGTVLQDVMTDMMFATSGYRRRLLDVLLEARSLYGGDHRIAEDVNREPVTYNQLLLRAFVLGGVLARQTAPGERVGVLLPTSIGAVVTFFALHTRGRIPAMLNFSSGAQAMASAVETARIKRVYTARRFIEAGNLQATVQRLGEHCEVVYLEDLRERIGAADKLQGWLAMRSPAAAYRRQAPSVGCDDPAVILFTSGTEGAPKGVVLTHANLLANRAQIAARVDFTGQDVILNAMPLFHAFGLTAGALIPLLSGVRVFFYPSPLHYRIIPELSYELNATILFGTNTFLAGYARYAHPYDFYSLRHVFAGAERLQEETRRVWMEKFGVRILEGYGTTETAPVISINTPMDHRAGSVGRALPAIEYALLPAEGISDGGRLLVRGPNVMKGYLMAGEGEIVPPCSELGDGWYDTGDIVEIDAEGFLWIRGRAKRFAKVGGEMVALNGVEMLAEQLWPGVAHAAITLPDAQKGERVVLLTEQRDASRRALAAFAKRQGAAELMIPRAVLMVKPLPLLGSGKVDYRAAREIAAQHAGLAPEQEAAAAEE